ncbi:CG0192-related protein [Dactylosporangium sp. McL0621]|uniref:CG0192-related protein n=1 Tax=Dactylosporangium sp. McL0621 TaxID=3415678 RepID=UPI003CF11A5B
MALLYRADLTPGKLDLLAAWLPGRPWYAGPERPDLQKVSAFRFDDPAGAVGVETILVRAEAGGPVFQTPLTYRDAPLEGADAYLLGTSEHSVLGKRWIYDAAADPVYAACLATAVLTGGTEAPEELSDDGVVRSRTPSMSVRGTGSPSAAVPPVTAIDAISDANPTVVSASSVSLTIFRVLDGTTAADTPALMWESQPLALVRVI